MIITFLAVFFLLMVGLVAVLGYKFVIRRGPEPEEVETEKCSICRKKFDKQQLLLRQVGDYRLLYFCEECIEGLKSEAKAKYN